MSAKLRPEIARLLNYSRAFLRLWSPACTSKPTKPRLHNMLNPLEDTDDESPEEIARRYLEEHGIAPKQGPCQSYLRISSVR